MEKQSVKDPGTHFDPDITDIFLDHIDEIENVFEVHK